MATGKCGDDLFKLRFAYRFNLSPEISFMRKLLVFIMFLFPITGFGSITIEMTYTERPEGHSVTLQQGQSFDSGWIQSQYDPGHNQYNYYKYTGSYIGNQITLNYYATIDHDPNYRSGSTTLSAANGSFNFLTYFHGSQYPSYVNFNVSGVADNVDSDGDGVPDWVERQQGTDPDDPESFLDADGDGVPDYIDDNLNEVPPEFTGISPIELEVYKGSDFLFYIGDKFTGSNLSFSGSNFPSFASLTADGNIHGKLPYIGIQETYNCSVIAQNQYGSSSSVPVIFRVANMGADKFYFTCPSSSTGRSGQAVNYKVTTSKDEDGVNVSVTGLPTWLSYNSSTKTITGTVPATGVKSFSFILGASHPELSSISMRVLGKVVSSSTEPDEDGNTPEDLEAEKLVKIENFEDLGATQWVDEIQSILQSQFEEEKNQNDNLQRILAVEDRTLQKISEIENSTEETNRVLEEILDEEKQENDNLQSLENYIRSTPAVPDMTMEYEQSLSEDNVDVTAVPVISQVDDILHRTYTRVHPEIVLPLSVLHPDLDDVPFDFAAEPLNNIIETFRNLQIFFFALLSMYWIVQIIRTFEY